MALATWFLTISSGFIVFVIYTLFFGDSSFHEKGLIGKFGRCLGNFFDALCGDKTRNFLRRVLGARICGCLERTEDYMCLSRNPIMPSIYVAFVLFGFVIFMQSGWPLIGATPLVPEIHKFGAIGMVSFCFLVFAIALKADPGQITKENQTLQVSKFPYDEIMYHPGQECKTCKTLKPARSKHCRICNRCVSRFDHHCPWLNNCIGENNLRFFLLFLAAHSLLCAYGFFLIGFMMLGFAIESNLWDMRMYDDQGVLQPLTTRVMIQFILYHHSTIVCLGLALGMISLVLLGFLGYHLWLIAKGTTTNESFKWKSIFKKHQHDRRVLNQEKADAAQAAREKSKAAGDSEKVQETKAKAAADAIADTIPHVYNRYNNGFLKNLWAVFFPPNSPPVTVQERAAMIAKARAKKAPPKRSQQGSALSRMLTGK